MPWRESFTLAAATKQRWQQLQWLREHGCPWVRTSNYSFICTASKFQCDMEVLQFIALQCLCQVTCQSACTCSSAASKLVVNIEYHSLGVLSVSHANTCNNSLEQYACTSIILHILTSLYAVCCTHCSTNNTQDKKKVRLLAAAAGNTDVLELSGCSAKTSRNAIWELMSCSSGHKQLDTTAWLHSLRKEWPTSFWMQVCAIHCNCYLHLVLVAVVIALIACLIRFALCTSTSWWHKLHTG
jgi:hypothetical protein